MSGLENFLHHEQDTPWYQDYREPSHTYLLIQIDFFPGLRLEIFSLLPGHVAGVKSGLENFFIVSKILEQDN